MRMYGFLLLLVITKTCSRIELKLKVFFGRPFGGLVKRTLLVGKRVSARKALTVYRIPCGNLEQVPLRMRISSIEWGPNA